MSDPREWLNPILELRRVVVVGQAVNNPVGGQTIVTSVEIWNEMLVVRYTVTAPDTRSPGPGGFAWWSCTDDVGTDYVSTGGGGGGGMGHHHMNADFTPAPPDTARRLVLKPPLAPDEEITVDLS